MRILVTGGCGFIGVNLVSYLLENPGDDIVVLDNLSLGRKEDMAGLDAELVEGDIRDRELVDRLMKRVDAVVHLAADTRVMDSIEDPDYNFDVNVNGTYNLLRSARAAGVERFVFASTGGAILGDVTPPVHEGMVPRPISPYGASKLAAEGYCSAFAGSYGMKTVSLRFSNVYGPRSWRKGSVVAHFFKSVLMGDQVVVYGDGRQTRDFVHVSDICGAIRSSLSLNEGGQVFQLGTGAETSVNALLEEIRRCIGAGYSVDVRHAPARRGEILRNFCDISHARKALTYAPRVGLKEGLEKTWLWFKAHEKMFAGPGNRTARAV
jgi:UDP-glucose 4-epimerase